MPNFLNTSVTQGGLRYASLMLVIAGASCGGGDGPSEPQRVATSLSFTAGTGQVVRIASAAPVTPTVRVLDQNGQPMSGMIVTFQVITGGGALSATSATTGTDGTASTGDWIMGSVAGVNTIRATAQGGGNALTATLDATARLPRWTYMVYMAADNNLAASGVEDIEEMEAAGSDPEVQVILQAEFSPDEFAVRGCDASCANLPNFNTFRYAIGGGTSEVFGPNGTVTDIGNRAMTDPAQLREFVQWAKATYPAERYGLVLWNHGNGYHGLLADETSTGSRLMSLEDLRTALIGTGELDVLNFDMCLMAAYETLAKIQGLTKVAAMSEENEPGDGDPYTEILNDLQANPVADGRTLGTLIVEAYHASYGGDLSSTTKSAYDMAAFSTFESALGALASTLTANVGTLSSALSTAAAGSQKYSLAALTDIVNFLDSLDVRSSDAGLRAQIAAAKSAVLATTFRVASRARNGTHADANPVERSTGLHIVMPSGLAFDALPSTGPGSFAAYSSLYSGKPWTSFLAAWLPLAGGTRTFVDQGENRWQVYLVWDDDAIAQNVDVDFWILEPSGDLYIPFMGTVTPNGVLTGDSEANKVAYEGYLTNRYLESGRYKFYANLYADPQNFGPEYDVVYRNDQSASFSSLYSSGYPRLTTGTSWLDDPDATLADVEAGLYTDLQYAAFLDVVAATPLIAGSSPADPFSGKRVVAPVFPRSRAMLSGTDSTSGLQTYSAVQNGPEPSITAQQLKTVRQFMKANKASVQRAMEQRRPRGALRTTAPRVDEYLLRVSKWN